MNTPALTIAGLATLMHRTAEQAYDEDLRATGETDAAILAKLGMLDAICDPLWVSDHTRLTAGEDRLLGAAREALGTACDFLQERIDQAEAAVRWVPTQATPAQFTAKQKIRAAKLAESVGTPA